MKKENLLKYRFELKRIVVDNDGDKNLYEGNPIVCGMIIQDRLSNKNL